MPLQPALLVLGSSPLGTSLRRHARAAGVGTLLVPSDPTPAADGLLERSAPCTTADPDGALTAARELAAADGLLGVFATGRDSLALSAELHAEVLGSEGIRTALDPAAYRAALEAAEVPVQEPGPRLTDAPRETRYDVNAFVRPDGAFVPCGILARQLTAEGLSDVGHLPAGLRPDEERAILRLVEDAALALALPAGPLGAEVVLHATGPALVELLPLFRDDVTTSCVTPLVHARGPLQAWLAGLVDAGGPFDTLPSAGETAAGWMALRATTPGRIVAFEGLERARAIPGVEGLRLCARPGDVVRDATDERSLVGWIWATGWDADEVEERLCRATQRVRVVVEDRVVA